MIGSDVGPYRILEELGQGGMGTVYRAEITGDAPGIERGGPVALKLVHPQLLATPGFFKRFLREGEVGKRIRHENVVRTFDADATEVDGKTALFLVMEYVEGRNLREFLTDLRVIPEALLREIALQVAAGLGAIHEKSIVHRDLKPENVLITEDQQIRIMDLGVAKLQEASIAITREGQFAGSFLYAAPEQFRGRDVGPASDLYSLGAMLYELATGENPFRREDTAAVIHAQLHVEPPSPIERNAELSPFFAEVIRTLLAKDASERIPSATELSEILSGGESSPWWLEREADLSRVESRRIRIRVRREVRFVGRTEERRALDEAWELALAGRGRTIFIEGEAGIGKTRLLDDFLQSVDGESAHVLYGSYPPAGGLGAISEGIVGRFGSAGLAEALAPHLTTTPSLVPAFAAMMKHETPPPGSDPISGDVQHTMLGNLLRSMAAERPVLWVVDDLHFASADSRRLLMSLTRAADEERVLLVITARPGETEAEVAQLGQLEGFRRIPLGRLSPREVIQLAREAFRSESLADRLGAKIAYKSDGVPFFVFEMIRGLKDGGFLRELDDGSFEETKRITEIEVPSAVKDLVEARLRDLSEGQRAVLDVGAVMGNSFDPGLVALVLEEKKVRVLRDLAEIERRSGIVRGEAGGCRFDQYQIQEVLYQGLMPDLRSEYHSMIAEAREEREGLGNEVEVPGETAAFLALHHIRGSRPASAVPYLERALDHLSASYRNDEAVDLAEAALSTPGLVEGAPRVRVLIQRAERLGFLGRRERERESLEEAAAIAGPLGDPELLSRTRWKLGEHLFFVSDYDAATRQIEQVLEAAREAHDVGEEAAATRVLGNIFFDMGNYEDARGCYERSLESARSVGEPVLTLGATVNLGNVSHRLGRLTEAINHGEAGLELGLQAGHRSGESIARNNLGSLFTQLGQAETAAGYLSESLKVTREIAHRRIEGEAMLYRARLVDQQGDAGAAKAEYTQALSLLREVNYRREIADALIDLGRLHLSEGRRTEAQASFEEALETGREVDAPEPIVLAGCHLARFPDGDEAAARASLEEHRDRIGVRIEMEARFALHDATRENGDIERAYRLLQYMVENAPGEYHQSMIEYVPLHRDIAAAWNSR